MTVHILRRYPRGELVFNLTYRGESFKASLSKGEWREAIEQWADGVDDRAARLALAPAAE